MRFSEAGSVWEFSAPVVRKDGDKVILGHANYVRFINRRRFPRVSIDAPGKIAHFPFSLPSPDKPEPKFVPATLNEIGGPGMKFVTPLKLKAGDKVIVIAQFEDGKSVESIARVCRTDSGGDGMDDIAVELIGLTSTETSDLVHETNQASLTNAKQTSDSIDSDSTDTGDPNHA